MGKSFNDIHKNAIEMSDTKVFRIIERDGQQIKRTYKHMSAEFTEVLVKPTEEFWFDDLPH